MRTLLVGTGYMAREYAKVLVALNNPFDVVGRSEKNCAEFASLFPGINVIAGGLEKISDLSSYTHAIISSNVDFLSAHTRYVIERGIRKILLEKPGGVDLADISSLSAFVAEHHADVFIAYNRRFYASVQAAKKMIEEDGGVLSFNFEFTEWPHTIEEIPNFELGRQNLLFSNSSHVIDMAFFMGGFPEQMQTFAADKLEWHTPAIFTGAGRSGSGALFAYQANWRGPGRWSVEMITKNRRLVFRPLEQLQVQQQRTVRIEPAEIDDKIDKDFKPGLYKQTEAFLTNPSDQNLITLKDHARNCSAVYQTILTGGTFQ